MAILPKEIPIKMSMTFFHSTRRNNPKIHMETQKTKLGGSTLPDFRLQSDSNQKGGTVIETDMYINGTEQGA